MVGAGAMDHAFHVLPVPWQGMMRGALKARAPVAKMRFPPLILRVRWSIAIHTSCVRWCGSEPQLISDRYGNRTRAARVHHSSRHAISRFQARAKVVVHFLDLNLTFIELVMYSTRLVICAVQEVSAGGKGRGDIGMDMYTFCEALGPEEVRR